VGVVRYRSAVPRFLRRCSILHSVQHPLSFPSLIYLPQASAGELEESIGNASKRILLLTRRCYIMYDIHSFCSPLRVGWFPLIFQLNYDTACKFLYLCRQSEGIFLLAAEYIATRLHWIAPREVSEILANVELHRVRRTAG
jgi:hypothetical protein